MSAQAHTIQAVVRRRRKRVGRGNGSQKGTYSSRGLKGQRARSGGKSRTERRGYKQSLQKIPKLRGFKSQFIKPETVTLQTLERTFSSADIVSPLELKKRGIIRKISNGVKIVATGTLTKKLTVKGCFASKSAGALIEKAGGTLTF